MAHRRLRWRRAHAPAIVARRSVSSRTLSLLSARRPTAASGRGASRLWSVLPPLALGAAVLLLGVYVPPRLADFLRQAVAVWGAH